jgi:two-component system phosphate regulon response regulator PhoB
MGVSAETKILFVEDDICLQKSVGYILEKEGFKVTAVRSGEEAFREVKRDPPDLILLDLILPGMNGFELCRILKKNKKTAAIFIVMVTGKGLLEDIIKGLEQYADDYITKPFEPRILIARINALLRRWKKGGRSERSTLEYGSLSIRPDAYEVLLDGKRLHLTKTEFDILVLLAGRPNFVFSRSQILNYVREDDYSITIRVVDYQVSGLRKKLGHMGEYIETIRGVGYKFNIQ